jgi:hypothetical protein
VKGEALVTGKARRGRGAGVAFALGAALAVGALPGYVSTLSGPVGVRAGYETPFDGPVGNPLVTARAAPLPSGPPLPVPAAVSPAAASAPAPAPALATAPTADPVSAVVSPDRLRIPAVGVDARVTPIGVDDTGALAVPDEGSVVGWWAGGPPLTAATGTTVLVGHVDTREGPGALSRLSRGQSGQQVEVSVAGSIRTYVIESVESVRREDLGGSGAFDQSVPARLAIVTCTGPYDADGGGYRDNLVVYAVPSAPGAGV